MPLPIRRDDLQPMPKDARQIGYIEWLHNLFSGQPLPRRRGK